MNAKEIIASIGLDDWRNNRCMQMEIIEISKTRKTSRGQIEVKIDIYKETVECKIDFKVSGFENVAAIIEPTGADTLQDLRETPYSEFATILQAAQYAEGVIERIKAFAAAVDKADREAFEASLQG